MDWAKSILPASWRSPALSPEEQVRTTVDSNEATLEQLYQQYDAEQHYIEALEQNVKRFNAQGQRQAAMQAFRTLQRKKKRQLELQGKIDMLCTVSDNLGETHTNIQVHGAIKETNTAFGRIATTLSPDDVDTTLLDASEYAKDHEDVSGMLSDVSLLDPTFDEDAMASDFDAFVNGGGTDATTGGQTTGFLAPVQTAHQRQEEEARLLREQQRIDDMIGAMPLPPQQTPVRARPMEDQGQRK